MEIAVVGGGAAGFFAAITCAESNPNCRITIFERGKSVLEKVRISGGGRCNVTHACFDAKELIKFYPRGSRELLGPFTQFGPSSTIEWFERHGVRLKTEADGRMFPVSNSSQTIVDCLTHSAHQLGIKVLSSTRVEKIEALEKGKWRIGSNVFDKLMIASGSSPAIWDWLKTLGHEIVPPVPSLFTFNTKDPRLRELAGVSAPFAALSIPGTKLAAEGPLLITHWGLSGPAVLRISAWGARRLHELDYKFKLQINFAGTSSEQDIQSDFLQLKQTQGKRQVMAHAGAELPLRLWQRLCEAAGIPPERRWADLSKQEITALQQQICAATFQITGKSTFKEEFVTAGGISLKEVNFKSFSSRLHPNLFFAGEVLDVDAITGGFNFQAAWTGGYLAGLGMGEL
jgi:predicted Rossmann fold flavoprotein